MGRGGFGMKSMSAKDAKNGFGLLLDTARAEPVTIEKHGRAVVVVISVEEYVRLSTRRRETLSREKSKQPPAVRKGRE
jgi:prevent-host-death family protein